MLGDDGVEDEHPDKGSDVDVDADGEGDDDRVWPEEYLPTIVVTEPDAGPEMVVSRITPSGKSIVNFNYFRFLSLHN